MPPTPYPHKIVLLRSGFQYPSRHLFFARARLYFDRIELAGWEFNTHRVDVVALDDLDRIEWKACGKKAASVVLHRRAGAPIALTLEKGRLWKRALELRLSWRAEDRGPLPFAKHNPSLRDLAVISSSFS